MEHTHDHEPTHHPVPHEHVPAEPARAGGTPAWLLPASILVAAILISGSLIYMVHGGPAAQVQDATGTTDGIAAKVTAPAAEDRDAILGKADAPVSIVQFEDFQCPFCAEYFQETESQIRQAYVESGKARIVYRHLAFLGPESVAAAAASECAKDQSKFWEYHDALFNAEIADGEENNGNLKRSLFMQLAKDTGLDEEKFASCIDGKTYDQYVQDETRDAGTRYDVGSTPTIFVNDQKVEGAYPFTTFQQIIDSFLGQ